jgi:hypothetical protein
MSLNDDEPSLLAGSSSGRDFECFEETDIMQIPAVAAEIFVDGRDHNHS